MPFTPDELAGTVDGFGGLTRDELTRALVDLAARSGAPPDRDDLNRAIDTAIEGYYLLEVEEATRDPPGGDRGDAPVLLIAGPAALPRLPEGGDDLPHLLDLDPRPVDRDAAARQAEERLRADTAGVIDEGDPARAEELLDACYEVEAWGPVDLDDAKAGLSDLLS